MNSDETDDSEDDADSVNSIDSDLVRTINMAIISNTGDEFEYNSDDGYDDSLEAYNDINWKANGIMSMWFGQIIHCSGFLDGRSMKRN